MNTATNTVKNSRGVEFTCPEVGMGATLCWWSDRDPYTIIKVSASGKTFWMQADNYKRIDNNYMSEIQDYEYTPNPNGVVRCVRLTVRGWQSNGQYVAVGHRRRYYDYSF